MKTVDGSAQRTVCAAPAAARRNRQVFRFYVNPLCRSCALRLVLRTQPRCYEYCQALASSLFVQLIIISG